MQLALAFQPNLLGVLAQFSQFDATLKKYLATATERGASYILDKGVANQHWQNPRPVLQDSFGVVMLDYKSALIGSPEPHARRREFGFTGMTDSLGRFYPHDPGAFFMTEAIADENTLLDVAQAYIDAIYGAWNELVGALPAGTSVAVGVV